MNQRSIACKCFVICMVLFCAYVQWSPVIDLDYLWINGHEHYVGAANPHQTGSMLLPALPPSVGASLDDFSQQLSLLPAAQSTLPPPPATTLRL
jgi:hypothetical protein